MQTKRYAVDRVTEELAVLVPDEGKGTLTVSRIQYGLSANDVVDVTFSGEKIEEISIVKGEGETRLEKNASRLRALFANNK